MKFHLFGIKLGTFRTMKQALPKCVISSDSTIWHGQRTLIQQPDGSQVKAWKVSGKSQLAYAYEDSLPAYEHAISRELGKLRPGRLPFLSAECSYPRYDALPPLVAAEYARLASEWRQELATHPYPDAFLDQLPSPLDAWFWP